MAPPTTLSPPRTPVAFRVGVSSHRPNRLREAEPEQLDAVIGQVLKRVRENVLSFHGTPQASGTYLPDPPRLCIASALAEGSDRLVAAQALGLGFSLCCPMPYAKAEYERDFDAVRALEPRSLETFHSLLEQARAGAGLTTFELDGSRSDPGASYGAAGRIVVNQSDLLIVVWDGREAQGSGGTIQTLHEAIHYQVPVLWIDAVAPHAWQLILAESDYPSLPPAAAVLPMPRRTPFGVS